MKWSRIATLLCVAAFCGVFAGQAWATKYVALGDSYSSGTGTRTFYESTCQRSVYAYPYLLHEAHPTWTFVDAACAGAKTGDILNTQAASLTSDTNWVTYTIGGNDAGFSEVITECALPSWASDCNGVINTAQAYIQNTLPGRLDLVNNKIKEKSPSAQVVVLDYPRLFNGEDCNAFTWFSPSEETRLNETADMLKNVIGAAASRAGSNFHLGNVIPPFIGHAVCDGGSGSSTEWINGLSNPTSESYHPKVQGHASGYYPVVHTITG
ncbi:MAG TPA: SGNH/GDSL hydrolase family protein [Solirubrobacterales bacterium]|jgi:lysophospholipase L1-like esterase|nr:SGNH/GDSL hydrolase family protein [Solirubrobacterales bacterium]